MAMKTMKASIPPSGCLRSFCLIFCLNREVCTHLNILFFHAGVQVYSICLLK